MGPGETRDGPRSSVSGIPFQLGSGGGGREVFDGADAMELNRARLEHLDSLALRLAGKSLLDVGCGVGHLARHFLERGCNVVCIDRRVENVRELQRRLPGVPAQVMRADADPLVRLGRFDVVLCYGPLDRLEDPLAGLRNIASVCDELLLLETVVSDHELPLVRLVDEPSATANQALDGFGSRPTPSFVAMALTRAGFRFVYQPVIAPRHPDFQFERLNNLDWSRDNRLLRCVFAASRLELENPNLRLLLSAPSGQNAQPRFRPGVRSRRVWIDAGVNPGEKTFAAAEADSNLCVYAFEPNLAGALERMGRIPNFLVLPLTLARRAPSGENVPGGLEPSIPLETFLSHAGVDRLELLRIAGSGKDLSALLPGASLSGIEQIDLELRIPAADADCAASTRDNAIAYLESAGFELERSGLRPDGRSEGLFFARVAYEDAAAIRAEARDIACLRPLRPRPGWRFGIDWDDPDPHVRLRRRIWSYCNNRNLHLPLEFDWHYGLKLALYLGNDTSRALFIGGEIDPNEFSFLDRFLRPGMVVADAGANEGLYTLFAARRVGGQGKVLAFEPSAREASRLQLNIERNSLSNVQVFPVALGSSEASTTLRVATEAHSGQNTLGEFIYPGVGLSAEAPVSVRSLDAVVDENHIARLDFLKLDVEGAETRLLYGAARTIRKFRPVLLLEVADPALRKQSSTSGELLALVQSFGYLLYRFDDATGLPALAHPGETSVNMIAVPETNPLPEEWCAQRWPGRSEEVELAPSRTEFPLFSLASQTIFNESPVSGAGPVFVSTPPQQWSFALGFPMNEKARRIIPPLSKIRVRLELGVEAGEIGIGVVNRELSAYLAPEMRYGRSGYVLCEIALGYLPPGSILIVRNTAVSGEVSKAIVRSIAAFVVGD